MKNEVFNNWRREHLDELREKFSEYLDGAFHEFVMNEFAKHEDEE